MRWKYLLPLLLFFSGLYQSAHAQCGVHLSAPSYLCLGDTLLMSAKGGCGLALFVDFNDSTPGPLQSNHSQSYTSPCLATPDQSPYLWMGTAGGQALIYTPSLNLSAGGYSLCFDMVYGSDGAAAPCDGPAGPAEAVYVQYSINNGLTWTNLQHWDPGNGHDPNLTQWKNYCIGLPTAAQSSNVRFRWTQLSNLPANSSCWGLDNIIIQRNVPTQYQWSTGYSGPNHPPLTPNSTTSYYVTVTSGTQSAVDSLTIPVYPRPTADFVSSKPHCKGSWIDFIYSGNADSTASYHWSFPQVWQVIDSNKMNAQARWNRSDLYTVGLHVDDGRCRAYPVNKQILIAPLISFFVSSTEGCEPLDVSYTGNVSPSGSHYLWDFDDGSSSDTAINPVHRYQKAGNYGISLIARTDSGCADTFSLPVLIKVYPLPEVDFTVTPPVVPWSDPRAVFAALSPSGQSFTWNFGDPGSGANSSNQSGPIHQFSDKGLFEVQLLVTSDKGCRDSTIKLVRVADDHFEVPNVITPNGDGWNETLRISNRESLKSCRLEIYNRWGKLIYQDMNYQNNWKAKGLADGVYYYRIQYESWFGPEEIRGFFHVLR